ncbi:MAG TPA: ATP-dependent DNA helicase RecG, partial [Thermoanaerobaculia bacterium]|nr:ATP-dependent DNA helicase RecG [Thermoanaerobaculia bacterium]
MAPDTPLREIKGIGSGRAAALEAAGLATVRDLLWFFPYRYEDRRHPTRIADLGRHLDEPVLIRGRVVTAAARLSPRKRMQLFEAVLQDESGAVRLVWFNQRYLADQIRKGDRLAVFGAPRRSPQLSLQIESPDWERFEGEEEEEGAIVPIYSKVANIPPRVFRRLMATAVEAVTKVDDPLPAELRETLRVIELGPALRELHQPGELDAAFLALKSPAHRRIILQEFFAFQLALRLRRRMDEGRQKARVLRIDDALRDEVRQVLPFKLTRAQKRVLREIADDLRSPRPMYRLLQGDVGSGKTIVALIAALIVIRSGHQVALLAPTEILVEQHAQRIRQLVDGSVMMATATGSMSTPEKRTVRAGLREGYLQLVVGTHALLEESVRFKSLGLAIVDEQHRFGVEQRQRLFAKGDTPDVLVMTATPIPRSLALAIYGELELSVIDELPPGRQRIKTAVRSAGQLPAVYEFLDREMDARAQVYVVYPLIEESEKVNLKPLTAGFETMRARFPNRRIAMLHGRMSAEEKEGTMNSFKRGEIDMLVSTTVIEVGIDVPNASVMLIADGARFGLSQLHQLRGRVGRGERKSYCIVVYDEETSMEARERLRMFEKTLDGFQVAEHDLALRGPGEFLGTRQSGIPRFHFGNILRDHQLMEEARSAATRVVDEEGI